MRASVEVQELNGHRATFPGGEPRRRRARNASTAPAIAATPDGWRPWAAARRAARLAHRRSAPPRPPARGSATGWGPRAPGSTSRADPPPPARPATGMAHVADSFFAPRTIIQIFLI